MILLVTLDDTPGNSQALVYTLADTVPELEEQSVGDTWGGAQALVDVLADTVTEAKALTTGDTLGDAQALNYRLVDSWRHTGQCGGTSLRLGSRVAELEAVTPGTHWAIRTH